MIRLLRFGRFSMGKRNPACAAAAKRIAEIENLPPGIFIAVMFSSVNSFAGKFIVQDSSSF
jgi:hypothetical protein